MEWDNLAVLPVSTFENWWDRSNRVPTREIERVKPEKKGVVLREVPCDEALFKGICGIYDESPVRQGRDFLITE